MANSRLVCIAAFLLALMFSYAIISATGRPLKTHLTTISVADIEAASAPMTEPPTPSPRHDGEIDKLVDDFRPTDPGHSPGAGHGQPSSKENPSP